MIKGKISEIFNSIQGEGLYLGERQLFVRFFGCNLKCKFCDTKIKYYVEYEPEQLSDKIKLYHDGSHSVVFTGGEPLAQKDFIKEVLRLNKKNGFLNYLETNGTLNDALEEVIGYIDIIAMDLKFSTSTGMANFFNSHRDFLKIASQKEVFLKAVVCNSTIEDDLAGAINLIKEINKALILVLQPNSYERSRELDAKLINFRETCAKNGIVSCIIPQVHKIVGVK
jgi:organic radical activating enzyme